ncbi:MAG: hypothetical protein KOO60_05885 [Gemmatimonadales bacterium]|nr:hypothetical protein [Gemmatimonadales bacterium]
MNRADEDRTGLTSGRKWGAFPAQDNGMEWSVDPESGLVQGPLDLEFLRGKRIRLSLEPGQFALLVDDNSLQAVYLEGSHQLEIGNSRKQISTSSSLIFLAANQTIKLRWTKLDPVNWKNQHCLDTIGHCSLQIDAPARFYRSFLDKTTCWDEQSINQSIDAATRGALSTALESSFPDGQASEVEIQSRLMHAGVEEITERLSGHGLKCSQLAVYTAAPPIEHNPSERTGQFSGLVHN